MKKVYLILLTALGLCSCEADQPALQEVRELQPAPSTPIPRLAMQGAREIQYYEMPKTGALERLLWWNDFAKKHNLEPISDIEAVCLTDRDVARAMLAVHAHLNQSPEPDNSRLMTNGKFNTPSGED